MKRFATLHFLALCVVGALAAAHGPAVAETIVLQDPPGAAPPELIEPPFLAEDVAAGKLPPVARRIATEPLVVRASERLSLGVYGGDWHMLVRRAKDLKLLVVYGYSRLVCYDVNYNFVPDILKRIEVKDGRVFTFSLRKGHKWSDGHPFTSEDFRFYWEDYATNLKLAPAGPHEVLLVGGEPPRVEIIDETTVRYSWSRPNPNFLPALAGASPLFIYRPAHYLKRFHERYTDLADLEARAKKAGKHSWAALFNSRDNMYRFDNPDLPTLQPWVNTTRVPATRFIARRNPYFHRVDEAGRQLPYIDRVLLDLVDSKLIPAKVSAGETDLQARGLNFNHYTLLKAGERRSDYRVQLWRTVRGAHLALYPNLNSTDPEWRALTRDVRFRRALSLAINRNEINQVIYYGLAIEGNNTVQPVSPLYKPEYASAWAGFDLAKANALLDEIGLIRRGKRGVRLLPSGRPLEIIVETAGEDTEQTDVLELIHDSWLKAGIKLYTRPSQREVFRNRIFAGKTQIAIWFGYENGAATPDMSPAELAPTSQQGYQWPKWGQYYETSGFAGEPIDLEAARELFQLNTAWYASATRAEREAIWHKMLKIHAEQVFTIGIVSGVPQPIVVSNRLRNVPVEGVYNWDPGAHFGIYRPETFWFAADGAGRRQN